MGRIARSGLVLSETPANIFYKDWNRHPLLKIVSPPCRRTRRAENLEAPAPVTTRSSSATPMRGRISSNNSAATPD
jgi:hypothetical protein